MRRGARWTLVVLTVLNFLNYLDRSVLPPLIEKMKGDPAFRGTTDAGFGLLQTAFLVVYMMMSPATGLLSRRLPRKLLVATGCGLWSLATVASGLAHGYTSLLVARAAVGIGEAAYATVAPAVLSDLYPRDRRSRVLAFFYLATPVGSALGYLVGGACAQAGSWRSAFFFAGGPGLLFALLALTMEEPRRGALDAAPGGRAAPDAPAAPTLLLADGLRALLRSRDFLRVTAGTTAWVFGVGALAFWLPSYYERVRRLGAGSAGTAVGLIAVVSGIVGTLAGGWLGDAWAGRERARNPAATGQAAYFTLSGVGLLVAAPLVLALPLVARTGTSLGLLFFGELFIFLNTGPLNTALVNAVPPSVRELGIGLHVLCIHLFGDAVSPALFGLLHDALGRGARSPARAFDLAVAAMALPIALGGVALLAGLGRAGSAPGDDAGGRKGDGRGIAAAVHPYQDE